MIFLMISISLSFIDGASVDVLDVNGHKKIRCKETYNIDKTQQELLYDTRKLSNLIQSVTRHPNGFASISEHYREAGLNETHSCAEKH